LNVKFVQFFRIHINFCATIHCSGTSRDGENLEHLKR
jgi:hypothetical protein